MKIINIHKWDSGSGGAGRYYLNHERILSSRGHDVIPWATGYSGNRSSTTSQNFFAPASVDFGEFNQLGLLDKAKVASSVVWNQAAANALTTAIKHFQPNVIHVHNIYHQLSGAVIEAAARTGVPVVQSLHDFSHFCIQSHLYRQGSPCSDCIDKGAFSGIRHKCFNGSLGGSVLTTLSRWISNRKSLLEKISGFTTPSHEIKTFLIERGIPANKILVVDNPFLTDELPIDLDDELPATGDYVAAWGTFAEMKGFGTLCDAIERMSTPTRLKLFTKDAHAANPLLRARVARLQASGRLTLVDDLRFGTQLFRELSGARLLIVPSEWFVTQEYTVWEGMFLARPVVVGDRGGNKELVGLQDLIFKAGDAADLATTLDRLLKYSDQELNDIGKTLRNRAVQRSNPAMYGAALEAFYREAC